MEDSTSAEFALFFEVFEGLPRQGPGSFACTERALRLCDGLPKAPAVLDLGCGGGAQTLDLAELTQGDITALDSHAPLIEQLQAKVAERDLQARVHPIVGDMAKPEFAPGRFDLIWSEGALYNIGIDVALKLYHDLLKAQGYMAFTEAVWREANPPEEVVAMFADYPAMGDVDNVIATIAQSGFKLVDHFPLPNEAWIEEFYAPMEQRIGALRKKYSDDPQALATLDDIAKEPALHRRHPDSYGYEFFVVQRA